MSTTVATACPLDCPDLCTLEVTVEAGRIVALGGGDHPVTQGFICKKVSRFGERVEHPERLLTAMRRRGPKGAGDFVPIGWDEAIDEIAGRLRRIAATHGGEAILPYHYGGSNGLLSESFLDELFFARLGASRLGRTLCAVPTTLVALGMYGKMPGVGYEDYPQARAIVIWGANPKVSHIHLVPFLRRAKERGAFVAVVDPRRNFSPREIDLHLPVLPGTDLPVALAMIRLWQEENLLDRAFLARHAVGLETLLERAREWPVARAATEAGVPAADVERLAEVYAAAHPAVIRVGWGLERNANGGQALAAVLAMPALLGKLGVRGGGYTLSNSGAAALDRSFLGVPPWSTRIVNMSRLGAWLLGEPPATAPPIQALFVYDANPAVTVPDQNRVLAGLAREDLFTVVFDQLMTDTARYADVLLPATTFLEQREIRVGYGNYGVGGVRPVIPPRGEARSNAQVFAALGRAMGYTDEPFGWSDDDCFERTAAHLAAAGRPVDAERLAQGGVQRLDFPGANPVQLGTVHPRTADGKIHLTPAELGPEPFRYRPLRDPRHPLALISPATAKSVNSMLAELDPTPLAVTLHPHDAAARGIAAGDPVRVFNDLGEVLCRARLSGELRPGVAHLPKGVWRRSSANGATATALVPDHVNVVGGGACFNDARVEVELRVERGQRSREKG